jgi:hypothetical protein
MKTTIMQLALSIIISLCLLTGCEKADSGDVNQDKIYSEYELSYDKNQDKTYASAIFKFNSITGTQLQLTAPSEVKFNGELVPYDPVFAYYRKEYAGQINSGTFTFKDKNGLAYINMVTIAAAISNTVVDTIKRTGAYTYVWLGDSCKNNELIGLTIGNNINPLNFQFFLQNTLNSKNLVLPLAQLNQLPVGNSYCQLDRQVETAAQNVTSAGGKVRGKYRGPNKNVYIK